MHVPFRLAAPLLALVALGLMFLGTAGMSLKGCDECFYAQIAREMRDLGDWLTPRYEGVAVFDKPPLLFWAVAAFGVALGESAFAARLPAMLAGLVAIALVFVLAWRERQSPAAGFWAGAVMASSVVFAILTHQVMTDALALAAICALALGVLGLRREARWGWLVGPALGLLVLAKGALAALVVLALAPYWAWRRPRLGLPLWAGLALGLGPAVAWYAGMSAVHGAPFWQSHIGLHVVQRAGLGVTPPDALGPAFYLVHGLWLLLPWTFLLPGALATGVRRARAGDDLSVFALGFGGVFLGVISLMTTKYHHYLLPAVLPVALLVATWLDQAGRARFAGWANAALGGALGVVAVLIGTGMVDSGGASRWGTLAVALALASGFGGAGIALLGGAPRAWAGVSLLGGLLGGFAIAAPLFAPWDAEPGLRSALSTVPSAAELTYVGPGPERDFCTRAAVRYAAGRPIQHAPPETDDLQGPGWYVGRSAHLGLGLKDRLAFDAAGWRVIERR